MAKYAYGWFWVISLLLSLMCLVHSTSPKAYIVYLGDTENVNNHLVTSEHHLHLLATVFESKEKAEESLIHSYKHAFSGFSSYLTATQADNLSKTKGVISVFESRVLQLHTTRSWDFMGLTLHTTNGTKPLQLAYGDDVIVGLIDTGVWPESASFKEEPNMGPVPSSWKGTCIPGEGFDPAKACSRKLIGARYYLAGFEREYWKIQKNGTYPEYRSARDAMGHGTHTASIAVGSRSEGAGVFGFAMGTARGGAPRARLAVYKACWNPGVCSDDDILAAFDDALHDGVHVISLSLGFDPPLPPFLESSVDIGAFHAAQKGVSVILTAGNSGPDPSQVRNVNPWSTCVAASTMDRSFPAKLILPDGKSFKIEGLINSKISGFLVDSWGSFSDGKCSSDRFNGIYATGKILLCLDTAKGLPVSPSDIVFAAYTANASAVIIISSVVRPVGEISYFPVLFTDMIQGTRLLNLFEQSNRTKLTILPSKTTFKRWPAPVVTSYSGRGPSSLSPTILKPDISAPGATVLGAWSPEVPPSQESGLDNRSVNWNFDSGTSMAAPHVTGVVALIKSAHPDWSPAAIKSALMTTAYNLDIDGEDISTQPSGKFADPFDIGAGHLNPLDAIQPGLVYDMTIKDHFYFLCNNGYSTNKISAIVKCQPGTTCPKCSDTGREPDCNLNHPSITVLNLKNSTTIKRTVRNVGPKGSIKYKVKVVKPNGVEVVVQPTILKFSTLNEEMTYYVTFSPLKISYGRYDFGSLTWSNGHQRVRSPLIVQVNNVSDDN